MPMPDDRPEGHLAAPAAAPDTPLDPGSAGAGLQQTLAMRITQRNLQRSERLARLRPPAAASIVASVPPRESKRASLSLVETPPPPNDAALEEFLRALSGGLALPAAREIWPVVAVAGPGNVESGTGTDAAGIAPDLAAAPCDLERLPGAGPGLIWALQRAGIARLADLAPLDPADLAARLGPLGRLVPAAAWIAAARVAG